MISGLPQSSGPLSFAYLNVIAGEDLNKYDIITIQSDGLAYKTNQPLLSPTQPYLIGICIQPAITSNPCVVQVSGKISNPAWILTPGAPLYFDSIGAFSEVPPLSGNSQIIGHALSNNSIYIQNFFGTGGAGGASLEILDEGVSVSANFSKLNVVGPNILAKLSGPGEVTLYSPPPVNVSHFNTYDAIGDATVNTIATVNRNISNPTSPGNPFNIGDWTPGTPHPAINAGILTYFVANPFSILDNSSTTFTVTVYGEDGITILAQNSLNPIVGDVVQSLNNITITISGFTLDDDLVKYKALVSVQINIAAILPTGGRFSILLEHNNQGDGVYTKTQGPLFYDSEPSVAQLSGVSISETVGGVAIKELSGAKYYTTDSQFTVAVADIDNINDQTYPTNVVQAIAPNYGLPQLNIPATDLQSWTNAHNNQNSSYNKTNWGINALNFFYLGTQGKASSRVVDWIFGPYIDSLLSSIAVDTYPNNSNRIFEDFNTESKRIQSNLTPWDSSQSLLTIDGGVGLQYINSRLMYPSINHSLYSPNPLTQPDYSGVTGNKVVYLPFYKIGQSFSNGKIQLSDYNITEADLSSNLIKFEISLNLTDWFNLNADYLGGTLFNNSGCRINTGTVNLPTNNQLEFTFGTGKFTSSSTGAAPNFWGAVLRITYFDLPGIHTKYIGGVNFISWV